MNGISTDPGPYCELHAHSCFSLLDGVPFPEELAERAAGLNMPAMALTDHDAVYGVVPFYVRARELGVTPILGAEMTIGEGHLTLLAETAEGYQNLCRLITLSRADRPKGEASLSGEALATHAAGLICLTGCRLGPVARPLLAQTPSLAGQALDQLLACFGRAQVYVELQRNLGRDDRRLTHALAALAHQRGLPCVATGNVHYLARDDGDLQDVLVSLRQRVPLPQAGPHLRPNHEYFLRSPAAMYALYSDFPQAVRNTQAVAERCRVELPVGLQVLPLYPTPPGLSAQAYLSQLCQEQVPRWYPRTRHQAGPLLHKELGLIEQLGLANYFLIVWDIVNFCRQRGILCHGRGSAANSLVAHLLGISAVDPISQSLVVERFLSVEHGGTPDIDLDIDAARRETVIQYVYERWGRDHAAMACTYVTFRSASAIRDAGYALGFKPETIDLLAGALEAERRQHVPDADGRLEPPDVPLAEIAGHLRELSHKLSTEEWQRLVSMAARLQKRPRHLGLHNGGMIVTGREIGSLIPVEPATMEARTVVQFDKEYLEQLGIVKIDLLGLRMLAAIADAVELVAQGRGEKIELERLDFRDKAIYDQICSAQTIGLFQVESGAQVSVIPHMQPRCFQDLVIEISLIRPGPLQGNMVRPYLQRRQGRQPVTYAHPLLQSALEETLGVIVFQEQVIKVARDFAGFTPGRGEVLRRALGHKHALEALQKFKDEFIYGALSQGVSPEKADEVWQMIVNFAGYSFSKAHAAAFAVIVYWSAWLRVHYPAEYFCGLLRNSPLGTYPANVLESEARRIGIKFLPFDINRSLAKATVEVWEPDSVGDRAVPPAWPIARAATEPAALVGVGAAPMPTAARAASNARLGWRQSRPAGGPALLGPRTVARSATAAELRGAPSPLTRPPSPSRAIRFGLDYVKGIGEERAETLIEVRGQRPFRSLTDFVRRACAPGVGLDRRPVEALVLAGAFDSFGERRQLLWDLAEAFDIARRPSEPLLLEVPDEQAQMAPMTTEQRLMRTFAATGVTAGMHLVEIRRDAFARAGCLSYRELQTVRNGTRVKAGGLVADGLRRPPTAKGTSFIRLEDADGLVDVIVPRHVYAECREALRAVFIVVEGTLQHNGPVLSLLAQKVTALPA